jgi:D-aminoacyl-tRNA deacylase
LQRAVKVTVCIAYSVGDPAGSGVASELLRLLEPKPVSAARAASAYYLPELDALLAGFDEDVLYFEFLDEICEADFHLVLSRHSSEAGIKSLTVHHPGNPMREALAGGRPLELPPSNPPLAKSLLLSLVKHAEELPEFKVTYEVTHHGPSSLRKPVTFVEIGSSAQEWSLTEARRAVAEAVVDTLTLPLPSYEACVGVGGNHYATLFTARALSSAEAYGHMLANYALKSLEEPALVEKVVREAATKSLVPTQKLVAERKLRKAWREALEKVAEELSLKIEYV